MLQFVKEPWFLTVALLCGLNLINYMDRYAVASVLLDIQSYFNHIDNTKVGLIQTSFICSYMFFAPLAGFLGDRLDKKVIILIGIFTWSLTSFMSSFVSKDSFWLFLFLRSIVGIGEASYSTIAPTIFADLFPIPNKFSLDGKPNELRLICLSAFYFAIPVGSGTGYILSSWVANFTGSWGWGLRITPLLGAILCYLFYTKVNLSSSDVLKKNYTEGLPQINSHETIEDNEENQPLLVSQNDNLPYIVNMRKYYINLKYWFIKDVKSILQIRSFRYITFGITWVSFVTGALALWAPTYMQLSANSMGRKIPVTEQQIGLRFGLVTCLAGALGLLGGSEMTRRIKKNLVKNNVNDGEIVNQVDTLVCGFAILIASPILMLAIYLAKFTAYSFYPFTWIGLVANWSSWIAIFLAECGFCSCWALVVDMTLSIVPSHQRSTSQAIQMLISHALGDASSSYIIGAVSQTLLNKWTSPSLPIMPPLNPIYPYHPQILPSFSQKFRSLQYALYLTPFVGILGAISFLAASFTINQDLSKQYF